MQNTSSSRPAEASSSQWTPSVPRTFAISWGSATIAVVPSGRMSRASSSTISFTDSMCMCASISPGATQQPAASIVSRALVGAPTPATTPSTIATSASSHSRVNTERTRPPRTTRSAGCVPSGDRETAGRDRPSSRHVTAPTRPPPVRSPRSPEQSTRRKPSIAGSSRRPLCQPPHWISSPVRCQGIEVRREDEERAGCRSSRVVAALVASLALAATSRRSRRRRSRRRGSTSARTTTAAGRRRTTTAGSTCRRSSARRSRRRSRRTCRRARSSSRCSSPDPRRQQDHLRDVVRLPEVHEGLRRRSTPTSTSSRRRASARRRTSPSTSGPARTRSTCPASPRALPPRRASIGYVVPFAIPEVIRHANAFALGVQKVNPKAKVKLVWTNSWFDPAKEKKAAESLVVGRRRRARAERRQPATGQVAQAKGSAGSGTTRTRASSRRSRG